MNTYLATLTEDGTIRRANMILAPDAEKAESLMRQAWPARGQACVYDAYGAGSADAQQLLERLAGNVQLGYPLVYRSSRRVQIMLELPDNVTLDSIREDIQARWPQPTNVTVKEIP